VLRRVIQAHLRIQVSHQELAQPVMMTHHQFLSIRLQHLKA
jgi:hypothetical protein